MIVAPHFRKLTPELVERATHIFAMSYGHLQAIEMMYPEYLTDFRVTICPSNPQVDESSYYNPKTGETRDLPF